MTPLYPQTELPAYSHHAGQQRETGGRFHRKHQEIMTDLSRPEVVGTRAGNAIRFTCPVCQAANSIVYNMPKDFFKETRNVSCTSCRKQCTVSTPGGYHRKPRVYTAPISR